MAFQTIGGSIVPARVVTGRRIIKGPAIRVFNAVASPNKVEAGEAEPIVEITSDDLLENGGTYRLIGGPAIPMVNLPNRRVRGGSATLVYPVDVNGAYDPSFAGYIYKVLTPNADVGYDPSSLIGFWPQNELTGAVSIDYSGLNHDGAYTGVTLGQPGVPGMGMTSPFYDGTNDFNNIYSAGLAAAFNGVAGTIFIIVRVTNAGVWLDGSSDFYMSLQVNAANRVRILKSAAVIDFSYIAGGVASLVALATASLDWMWFGLTWDKNAGGTGEMRAYFNGIQTGVTQVGLGIWAGVLGATTTCIGANNTGPGFVADGWLGPGLLYSEALPPAAIAYLSTV